MVFWLVQELVKEEQSGVSVGNEIIREYADEKKPLEDLLRSPMTLTEGARIMNEWRKRRGEDDEEPEVDA